VHRLHRTLHKTAHFTFSCRLPGRQYPGIRTLLSANIAALQRYIVSLRIFVRSIQIFLGIRKKIHESDLWKQEKVNYDKEFITPQRRAYHGRVLRAKVHLPL
jgi:hypothetical protein